MVFDSKTMGVFTEAITALFNRVLSYNPPPLTHENILTMFVPEGDRDVLKRAHIVGADNYLKNSFEVQWAGYCLHIEMNSHGVDHRRGLAPRNPYMQDDAPPELINSLEAWVKRRVAIGTDFSRVNVVLHSLNEICTQPTQMRYAWPSIVALAGMSNVTRKIGNTMDRFKQPRTIPRTQDLRHPLQMASATVASALLLEVPSPCAHEVTIHPSRMPPIVEPPLSFIPW